MRRRFATRSSARPFPSNSTSNRMREPHMATWLMDTALFKMLASPKATILRQWVEANNASLFLSAASLTEIAAGIAKTSADQLERGNALRIWIDDFVSPHADRIHLVD